MQVHLGQSELRHFAELNPDSMRGENCGFGRDCILYKCAYVMLAAFDFKSHLYVPSLGQQEPFL